MAHGPDLSLGCCHGWFPPGLPVVGHSHTPPPGLGTGSQDAVGGGAHRALVGLLARVPPHVHHQHVLRLEGLLLPRARLPAAHELFLLPVDVLIVDVLRRNKPDSP